MLFLKLMHLFTIEASSLYDVILFHCFSLCLVILFVFIGIIFKANNFCDGIVTTYI